jgi:hypothetical protein
MTYTITVRRTTAGYGLVCRAAHEGRRAVADIPEKAYPTPAHAVRACVPFLGGGAAVALKRASWAPRAGRLRIAKRRAA